jgi:glutamate-ammonia-ligase adenylyltransferase
VPHTRHPTPNAFAAELRARAPGLPEAAEPLLQTIGAHSPYLSDLARREPATVEAILRRGPDSVCDAALLALSRTDHGSARRDIAAAMRLAKRHVALATAIADIGGVWRLEQVTGALSDLADMALRLACRHLLAHAHARGDLRLPHPASPDRGCGFCVLAMGKLGAHELNYSSDVDLILLYDPNAVGAEGGGEGGDGPSPDLAQSPSPNLSPNLRPDSRPHLHHGDHPDLGPIFARMARDLTQLMEARDSGGYVFRVDLRLRPDPASTPPAVALPGALAYYESQGQTWERAALIKARPVAGDIALGRRFLEAIRPFIWRRHLDFAALADISAMKRRIDAHKGTALAALGPDKSHAHPSLLGHDLKLGQGGIREIEFCAQALQLVWGGRVPALRLAATLPALYALAGQGHFPPDTVAALEDAYRFLRRAEHRLQMVADRQTHSLPDTESGLAGFAAFMGFAAADFAREALAHLLRVTDIFAGLFAAAPAEPDTCAESFGAGRFGESVAEGLTSDAAASSVALAAGSSVALAAGSSVALAAGSSVALAAGSSVALAAGSSVALAAGWSAALAAAAEGWLAGRPRALRTERSRLLLRDMLPAIGSALARQSDPAAAVARLDELIYRLPAGVQVFSLLHHNPALLERLAEMLSAAPALADHLASFPASLEGLVAPDGPAGFATPPLPRLIARMADATGLDDAAMIAARMVRAEEFAIASAEFFGRIDVDQAAAYRTALVDAAIRVLTRRALAAHVARHGTVAGGGMAVVALGKVGSGEMMAGSDLDMMLIYSYAPDAGESSGAAGDAPRNAPSNAPSNARGDASGRAARDAADGALAGAPTVQARVRARARARLPPSQYFARAAQSVIAALTLPTRHGPLYAVDMRLRPSGSAGPVAVSLDSFIRYHASEAWTWERLALTRARVITAPGKLRRAVQAAIAQAMQAGAMQAGAGQAGDSARVLADTRAMRARMARDLPVRGRWDVRRRPGGLLDVEFIAQALQLVHAKRFATGPRPVGTAARLAQLARLGALPAGDAAMLAHADRTFRCVQSLLRIGLGPQIPAEPPAAVVEKIARATGLGPDEAGLIAGLDDLAGGVRAAFLRHIGEIEGS